MTSPKKKVLGALLIIVSVSATAGGLLYTYWDHLHEDQYIEDLRSGDALRKIRAAQKLGEIRSLKAVPTLVEVVERPVIHRTTGHSEAEVIVRSTSRLQFELIKARIEVSDIDEEEKRDAISHLGSFNDATTDAMGDPEVMLRAFAIDALKSIDRSTKEVMDAIVSALDDPNALVRLKAAQALGRLRGNPEKAVPALIERLEDPKSYVRRLAVVALGEYGLDAAAAIPTLESMLDDPPEGDRRSVEESLERIRETGEMEHP